MGELRRDPLSGRLVAFAPSRAGRPGAGGVSLIPPVTDVELEECPFCAGRESHTPAEVLAVGRDAGAPNTPGWTVRVVPNRYPAFERHEVVVHSPRHKRSFAELSDTELDAVAKAWAARMATARRRNLGRRRLERYVHAFINEGAQAGGSLTHSHSQLVWLDEVPPQVASEGGGDDCAVCDLVAGSPELVVERRDGVTAQVHPAGRAPYEMLVAGEHGGSLAFVPMLSLVREVVRRLRALEGPLPWNAWLHVGHPPYHPHLELVPRLTVFAGLELGAGVYLNTLPPEEAAARLRDAISR